MWGLVNNELCVALLFDCVCVCVRASDTERLNKNFIEANTFYKIIRKSFK